MPPELVPHGRRETWRQRQHPSVGGDAAFPQLAIRLCKPLGGVAFQDHAATGGRRAHDQHPREHFNILVRQRDGGALSRLSESDGRTC